jgi:hypothetical protein
MKSNHRPCTVGRSGGRLASLTDPFRSLFHYSTGFNSGAYAGR